MSKFQPKESFGVAEGSYRLLPFNFARFFNNSVVLSNMAGEYTLIPEQAFSDFISGTLHQDTDAYAKLLEAGFLVDDTSALSLDLLAVKLRTKLSNISRFTSLHMIVVTLRCDHSCPYCQVSRQSEDKEKYDISPETAGKAVDLIFRSPSRDIKIEYQGGEPLLNFASVEFITKYAVSLASKHNKNVSFVIATNLSRITDDMLQFCKEFDVSVSTSLDGPKDLHNLNRPMSGADSFERVASGVDLTRRFLGRSSVSALMTTTEASLGRVKDIVDTYVEMGFPGIFLRPLSPYGFAIKTKTYSKYDTRRWLDFYDEGLEYILQLNRLGVDFSEFYSSTILKKMLTPFSPGYVDLMSPAGIGIAAVVYNYNGNIYASDEGRMRAEMGDETFRLGNVHANSYDEIFTSDELLEPLERSFTGSVPMCSDCVYEPYCGAEPVYHHATQGDFVGFKPLSGFCERNMHVIKRLMSIVEGGSADSRTLRRWSIR
ncbi:MAG: His-Xaa-Ser system radical SAM maturase HxsB [Ancalomicrobiaceae bacterium]|nr:His-Xaa-Ser system radical SAM maturase HxsB [Ancalomicrobiaceae bacterium]